MISTLLLNFVAESLVSLMVQGPLQEPTHIYPQSAAIAGAARLPLLPGTRLHAGLLLALAGAGLLWFLFPGPFGDSGSGLSVRDLARPRSAAGSIANESARSPSFFPAPLRDWPAGSR